MNFDFEKMLRKQQKRFRRKEEKDSHEALLAFLGGAAAGIITAVLLAPDDGETTLKNIKKKVKDLKNDMVDWAESVQKRAQGEEDEQNFTKVKGTVKGKAEEVKSTNRPSSGKTNGS